jgi:hypothetical protein
MRVRALVASGVCFAIVSTSALLAFDEPANPVIAEGLVLPVVLKQKIDTAKIQPGDVVKFELLSPVIANREVVVPATAKVYGKIVEANPLGKNPFSSLAVAIDSIVWKDHALSLHAHLAGFGKMKVTYFGKQSNCDQPIEQQRVRSMVRRSTGRDSDRPPDVTTPVQATSGLEPQCDNIAAQSETDNKGIEHIQLRRTRSKLVPVAFASTKRDIVLKKGTLMVIRNGAEPVTMGSTLEQNRLPRE